MIASNLLNQFREVLESDRRRRQAILGDLHLALTSVSEFEPLKRHTFEVAILAGERMLQASEARLRSLDETLMGSPYFIELEIGA